MKETTDVLQAQGINAKGYGTFPKMVSEDKRLTAISVAIYATFASYAGAGKTAFPKVTTIMQQLKLSKDTYYKHFNLLKKYGYIKVEQERCKGRYIRNLYTLPQEIKQPIPDKPETVKHNTIKEKIHNSGALQAQQSVTPFRNLPDTTLPDTVKQDTYKNNSIKNKQSFNNYHVLSSQSDRQDMTDNTALDIEKYTELIKSNIDYDSLTIVRPTDLRLIDEFIAIVLDVIITNDKSIRINGENKPRELVKHNLLHLDYNDINLAIDQFKSVTERINKKKQYIISMLYNCKMELNSHYTNLVQHDMWNGGGYDE